MARRSSPSRGSSAFGRGRSPSPTASRRTAPPPPPPQKAVAPQPPAPTQVAQPAMAASPGGGLMANVASTAAGVAIGHTVGHAITGALGMNGGGHSEQPVAVGEPQQQQLNDMQSQPLSRQHQQPLAGQDPCRFELEQFLSCAQNQSNDLTLCDGFNQVLRECKTRYGNMYQ